MTRKVIPVLSAAVGMALSGAVFAQAQPGASSDQQSAQQQSAASSQQQQGQQQQQQQLGDGKQVAEQISQQLDKIGQDKEKAADALFLLNAGIDSQFEVALSQAVEQKTQDQNVKQVAQRIIQDHTQANQQLMQTAQKLGLQVPQGVPEMKQKEIQVITSLDEQQMNQQYISCMQNGHARDVMAFRTAAQVAKDNDVKQFASQTLPTLAQHWQHVQQAATALGLPAGGRGAAQAGYRQGEAGGARGAASGSRSDNGGYGTYGSNGQSGTSGSSTPSGTTSAGSSFNGGNTVSGSTSGGSSAGGASGTSR